MPGGAPGLGAHERTGAADGVARQAKPHRRPQHVRDGQHGLAGNIGERDGQDLFGRRLRLDGEAEAARASHPERVPLAGPRQPNVGPADENEYLVGGGGVGGAPGGEQDVVGFLAVGDDRRTFGDPHSRADPLDGTDATAEIAADANLGSRGRDQPLMARELGEVVANKRRGERMADQAEDLDLVHRIDHGRGGTGSAEHLARCGQLADGRSESAEPARHERAEETLFAQRGDRLVWKPRFAIDGVGDRAGDVHGDAPGGLH